MSEQVTIKEIDESKESEDIKEETPKKKKKTTTKKPKMTPEEKEEYDELVALVQKLYGFLEPYAFKQIKDLKEKGVTYKQQWYVLWYISEVKKTFNSQYGLGQIEIHYREAREYAFAQTEQVQKINELIKQAETDSDFLGKTIYAKYKPQPRNQMKLIYDLDEVLDEFEK